MSNNKTNTTKNPFKTIFKIALVLDIIWACFIATYYALVIHTAGGLSSAGNGVLLLGTILAWILAFLVGLFQGAIFIAVVTVFICVGIFVYKSVTVKS